MGRAAGKGSDMEGVDVSFLLVLHTAAQLFMSLIHLCSPGAIPSPTTPLWDTRPPLKLSKSPSCFSHLLLPSWGVTAPRHPRVSVCRGQGMEPALLGCAGGWDQGGGSPQGSHGRSVSAQGSDSPECPRERLLAPGRARGQAGLAPPAQAG